MLKCSIVRDLLPTYIEGLTSEESNTEINEHLQGCVECTKLLAEMKTPLEHEEGLCENKEINYLKKIRVHNTKKLVAIIVGMVAVLGFGIYFFMIGSLVESAEMRYEKTLQNGETQIDFELINGNELRMQTEYIFEENTETGLEELTKILLKPYEVWPSPIYEGTKFLYGYKAHTLSSAEGNTEKQEGTATKKPVQIIIQFSDDEVIIEP